MAFTYDELHRLKTVDEQTSGMQREWVLDQLGNWDKTYSDLTQTTVETDRDHNAANELTGFTTGGWATPGYDAAGNMTTLPKPKDLTNSYTATYDAWNRLVELDGEASYEYDGLHRRIVRTEDSTTRHFYYNEKWQCLEEQTSSGAMHKQYVWHPYYIDALAVTYDDQGTKHFYCHDANFNITAVLDNSGDVVERYHYSPYGEVKFLNPDFTTRSDSGIANEFLYTGRRLDPVTGLQYSRYRYYIAPLGRWLTRDPIGYFDGYNLYAAYFVPNGLDPFGMMDWSKWPGWLPRSVTPEQIADMLKDCNNPKKCAELRRAKKLLEQQNRLKNKLNGRGRRGGRGGRGGFANPRVISAIGLTACEAGCAYAYNHCLIKMGAGYERCLRRAYQFPQPIQDEELGRCDFIWKLDATECAAKYAACALTCLCPFDFWGSGR